MTHSGNRMGLAGATLLYGHAAPVPDLVLVAQFLVDDLRRDGHRIIGARISSHALRLRVDGFDLAMTMAEEPLPPSVTDALLRPVCPGTTPDLLRGRVLHALNRHRLILGILLRARHARAAMAGDQQPADLTGICRVLIGTVAEAAPPVLVVWQANGAVLTPGEFRTASTAILTATIDRAGDNAALAAEVGDSEGAAVRLTPIGAGRPSIRARTTCSGSSTRLAANDGLMPAGAAYSCRRETRADTLHLDHRSLECDPVAAAPTRLPAHENYISPGAASLFRRNRVDSRAARAARLSAGRLFGKNPVDRCRVVTGSAADDAARIRSELLGGPYSGAPNSPERLRTTSPRPAPVRRVEEQRGACGAMPTETGARGALPAAATGIREHPNRATGDEARAGSAVPHRSAHRSAHRRSTILRPVRLVLLCLAMNWALPVPVADGGNGPAMASLHVDHLRLLHRLVEMVEARRFHH